MTISATSGSGLRDAAPAERSAVRGRSIDDNYDGPAAGFAASLASMLTPRAPLASKSDSEPVTSDLDARANPSDVAGAASGLGIGSANSEATIGSTPATSIPGLNRPTTVGASLSGSGVGAVAASVTDVSSGSDALNPDFRARLGRVVTRMREEFGSEVEIVEGFRPQTRQDFLYEQGRTRPGDVVTWTKSSKHTLGLAADVKIDGSYSNTMAYQRLAQIAAQEGLRTLGARDPGHVELPSRGGAVAWGAPADSARMAEGVARAVDLALAQGPSAVKDVASDAHALNGFLNRMSHAGTALSGGASLQPGASGGGGHGAGGNAAGGSGHHQGGRTDERERGNIARVVEPARIADVAQVARVANVAEAGRASLPTASSAAAAAGQVAPSTAADRVGRMLDARDATPAAPLSHVTLNLDNASGGTDRITVQLRGGAVDTAISLGDAGRADRMSLRVGELQHALEHHGLEAGSIHVGSAGNDSGAGWTPRRGSDQDAHQGQPSPNNRDSRQDADEARQRSRRGQQGEKQR